MSEELEQGLSAFDNGDYVDAFTILLPFADKGEVKAQAAVGFMYDTGQGTTQHFEKAVKYYTPAAEAGDAKAQFCLGVMYYDGRGVEQDFAEAVRWWRLAAEAGMEDAQINLGEMYANGNGVPQDYHLAYMWLTVVATQGKKTINTVAEKKRAKVAKHMTPKQITEAKRMADRRLARN